MPWPQKDFLTRFLAGAVGAILGALLPLVVIMFTSFAPHPLSFAPYRILAGAILGSVICFWIGDPAFRFLARILK
jgi:hypothetical protein